MNDKADLAARSRLVEALAKAAAHRAADQAHRAEQWATVVGNSANALEAVASYDEALDDLIHKARRERDRLRSSIPKRQADAAAAARTAAIQAAVVRAAARIPGEIECASGALKLAEKALSEAEEAAGAIEQSIELAKRLNQRLDADIERLTL